jgi:lantibiotic modifying enzyme
MLLENKTLLQKIGDIRSDLQVQASPNHYGLLGGNAGVILFYLSLYDHTQDEAILEHIQRELEKSVELFNRTPENNSWGYGLAGFAWLLITLSQRELIDHADIIDLDEVDETILKSLEEDRKLANYDCFSGIVGKGLYFLKRAEQTDCRPALEQITDAIAGMAQKDEQGTYWFDYGDATPDYENHVNFGLAHGMPSILNLLTMIHKKGIRQDVIETLLRGALEWMVYKSRVIEGAHHFPYILNTRTGSFSPHHLPGRLAWCYGDLGVASCFLAAGKILNSDTLYELGYQTALRMAGFRDAERFDIADASICHGSSGVALILKKLYGATSDIRFKEASDYWYGLTLDFLAAEGGTGGYRYWENGTEDAPGHFTDSTGFLEGASGTGLSLIEWQYSGKASGIGWESLLLLPL